MVEIVGKIGSMALIDREHRAVALDKFARIGKWLKPGTIWVSSGAVEIGRLDYINRHGKELDCCKEDAKTDYSSQGQATLMELYRKHIDPKYSIRQILVEHSHFNDKAKAKHIKNLLLRATEQNAIPIVNYNDAVSLEESRKLEIQSLINSTGGAVELVDNDETASQIACMVKAKTLLILSTLEGIYADITDSKSLIREVSGKSFSDVAKKLDELKKNCSGASRQGANGAKAKLEYIKPCIKQGMRVVIASAKYDIGDILSGNAPSTMIYTN